VLDKKGAVGSAGGIHTVRDLASAWTGGELFRKYGNVNKLRTLASAKIDAMTLEKHVLKVRTRGPAGPTFGDLPVAMVTKADCASVMAQHTRVSAGTLKHTYRRMHRLFDLAIQPCGLRDEDSNPVTRYLRPG